MNCQKVEKRVRIATVSCGAEFRREGCVYLRWLGQAGFAVRSGEVQVYIDPYLSDSLAEKYRGREFAHERMMAAPIGPGDVRGVDWLLCSHRHSDHLDPQTAPVILQNNPDCRLVAPKAERDHLRQLGLIDERTVLVTADERVELGANVWLDVIPSAHEALKTDAAGNHHYLGYVLTIGGVTLYHSGDCVPYAGLANLLAERRVDVALLPVNGRDAFRRARGVPGNMTFDEARQLCETAGIGAMVCHHFGMFDFNTIALDELEMKARAARENGLFCVIPNTNDVYELSGGCHE